MERVFICVCVLEGETLVHTASRYRSEALESFLSGTSPSSTCPRVGPGVTRLPAGVSVTTVFITVVTQR